MIDPQKHPIRTISLLILLTSITFQCSDNADTVPQQVIVGEWKISSVSCDGLVKPEWTGVAMRFTQITPDSGAYYVPETVNDSIWPAAGHWEIEIGDSFLRDDSVLVNYAEEKSKIMLIVYLPGPVSPLAPTAPVLTWKPEGGHSNWRNETASSTCGGCVFL